MSLRTAAQERIDAFHRIQGSGDTGPVGEIVECGPVGAKRIRLARAPLSISPAALVVTIWGRDRAGTHRAQASATLDEPTLERLIEKLQAMRDEMRAEQTTDEQRGTK